MTADDIPTALKTRLPVWMFLLGLMLAGGGSWLGAGTFANFRWNQNNEPRFEQLQSANRVLQRQITTMERNYAALAIGLASKVDRRERKEMLVEIRRRFSALEREVGLLEQRHMRKVP